jgi:hypothetical protein
MIGGAERNSEGILSESNSELSFMYGAYLIECLKVKSFNIFRTRQLQLDSVCHAVFSSRRTVYIRYFFLPDL